MIHRFHCEPAERYATRWDFVWDDVAGTVTGPVAAEIVEIATMAAGHDFDMHPYGCARPPRSRPTTESNSAAMPRGPQPLILRESGPQHHRRVEADRIRRRRQSFEREINDCLICVDLSLDQNRLSAQSGHLGSFILLEFCQLLFKLLKLRLHRRHRPSPSA